MLLLKICLFRKVKSDRSNRSTSELIQFTSARLELKLTSRTAASITDSVDKKIY